VARWPLGLGVALYATLAVLGMVRQLDLARLLDRQPSPERARVLAMVVQQVLRPGSKLACTRALGQSTLAGELAVEDVDADEEYKANEPSDLHEARQRYEGRWHVVLGFPLGESIPRVDPRLSLDRWEFEVDARFARVEEIT